MKTVGSLKTIKSSRNSALRIIDPKETASMREGLQRQENIRFVDRQEFSKLLISFRQLVRFDVARARIHGLHDHVSGIQYVIEEEKLFAPEQTAI